MKYPNVKLISNQEAMNAFVYYFTCGNICSIIYFPVTRCIIMCISSFMLAFFYPHTVETRCKSNYSLVYHQNYQRKPNIYYKKYFYRGNNSNPDLAICVDLNRCFQYRYYVIMISLLYCIVWLGTTARFNIKLEIKRHQEAQQQQQQRRGLSQRSCHPNSRTEDMP